MNRVYVVTMDGWKGGWGTEIYLVGVYDSRDLAESVVNELETKGVEATWSEATINRTRKIEQHTWERESFQTDAYLGGYVE